MDVSMEGKPSLLKDLHGDLGRKYKVHGTRIEQIWRSFNRSQRETALEGQILKNRTDRAMGNLYKIIPEWNRQDVAEPESDFLLDLLKHRATKSLCEQYREGVSGGQGDADFISHSMRVNNLRHANSFKYCFTMFIDEENYGESSRATDQVRYRETMAGLSVAVNAGLCVPQSTGELILERQIYTLQALNILVGDILEGGSTSKNAFQRSKKPQESVRAALSNLSIVPKHEKLSLKDLLTSALDQKSYLDDYLETCCTEPVLLAHVVNIWFFSRLELIKDEKGRVMPLITDKYISIAIFEVIHNAVAGAASWDYVYRLLQALVDGPNDHIYRSIILQEISNVCHMEFGRAQKLFKRYVQMGSGSRYFRRVSGVYDNGIARVTMKIKPELLTVENPQLHYMLRLCQAENGAFKSVAWIKKLDELHQAHPTDRDDLEERELDAFGDLAAIASFIHSLSASLPIPPISLRKGQMYVSKSKELAAELDTLKMQIDLADFAAPIDNLMEPGMAQGALNALDQFVVEKTGTKIGFLYQDLIEDCASEIREHCQQQKARIEENAKTEIAPPPVTETTDSVFRVQQRRQKDKTRPVHPSLYDIAPTTGTPAQPETLEVSPTFKVSQGTVGAFSTLFSKSESRGSISWAAFEAAMTDLKFSVVPKFGSVFTFFPPQDFGVQKSLTVHRPHKSRIEGHVLLIYARRLKRVYGWGEHSFELA